MRNAFSDALVRFATRDPNVLLLTGDHGYALFDDFRKYCPTQYINAGIAEQNMVGMAAGLAKAGFKPFVYGLSAFVPIRVLEQVKIDVCHDNLPVTFVGDGAGFVYSHLGTSHQSTEDIACTRALPGLAVLSPADRFEMHACMEFAYHQAGPVYLRMGKSDRGDVHAAELNPNVGEILRIRAGNDRLAFLATGSMVKTALELVQDFPETSVWSIPFIKPINRQQVIDICRQHMALVVFEEHSMHGGLGSVIAEISAEHVPVRVCRIGVEDRFSEYCGTYAYLLREHGLDRATIALRVRAFVDEAVKNA